MVPLVDQLWRDVANIIMLQPLPPQQQEQLAASGGGGGGATQPHLVSQEVVRLPRVVPHDLVVDLVAVDTIVVNTAIPGKGDGGGIVGGGPQACDRGWQREGPCIQKKEEGGGGEDKA